MDAIHRGCKPCSFSKLAIMKDQNSQSYLQQTLLAPVGRKSFLKYTAFTGAAVRRRESHHRARFFPHPQFYYRRPEHRGYSQYVPAHQDLREQTSLTAKNKMT
jgi:hypothetical protein